MNQDPSLAQRRAYASYAAGIPHAPPLPAPLPTKHLQRARDAASRFLGYGSRPPSPQDPAHDDDRFTLGSSAFTRSSSIGESQNATATHKTGLPINTLSINDSGTHAIVAGKEIFKTVRIKDGHCAEDFNLRTAIRSTPTQASGLPRKVYSIDIADVAWAKGDSGDYVAAATSSGKIIVYDLGHAGLQAAQLHEHYRHVHNITFNPHRGSLLLSGSQDGTVRLWDLRDLRDVRAQASTMPSKRKYSGLSDGVRDVKWSPVEGYDFAFGTDNGDVQRWDMRNLKAAKVKVPAHSRGCNTVDWHPDGKHIVSAGSDKTVRVFDFSSSRPRKPSWEIKTAAPVMQARWRPSCQSSMPHDNGAQQCTQIVTSYDKEHPVMHIWDFRRPLLPFRELKPYHAAPTDLLWHSQDLLWTVGREGTFLQTDIQHSPKVIDRCNLQTLDVSPLGELSFVAQARYKRRVPKPQPFPSLHPRTSSSLSTSPDSSLLSRSWADDGLDHSFLGVLPFKGKARSSSNSRVHGAYGSSSYNRSLSATIKLDDILLNRKSFRPQQLACRGQLPSQHNLSNVVAFMARHCVAKVPSSPMNEHLLEEVQNAFRINEEGAESARLLITAQTWKMVGHCTLVHLRERLAFQRKQTAQRTLSPPRNRMTSSIENLATRFTAHHIKSPTQSPGTMRPVSIITRQLNVPEGSSNAPTPLARPLSRGHIDASLHQQPLPDPDKDEKIALPPSLTSPRITSPPGTSEGFTSKSRRLTSGNLEDLQKLESYKDASDRNDMVHRWSTQPKAPLVLDPADAAGVKIPPSQFEHYGSGESFQFLAESTGSRGSSFPASLESAESPTLHMVSAHPSRPLPANARRSSDPALETDGMHQSMFFEGSGTLANSAVATKENSENTITETSTENLYNHAGGNIDTTDFAFRGNQPLEKPPAIPPRHETDRAVKAAVGTDLFDIDDVFGRQTRREPPRRRFAHANESTIASVEAISPADSVVDEEEEMDLEVDKPWTLLEMLQQLIGFYTAEEPSPQTASLLILLMGPLLPRTHPLPIQEIHQTISRYVDYFLDNLGWGANGMPSLIKTTFEQPLKAGLQPLQVESILSTYHEQLLVRQLFDEAAELRKLAYPAYPGVYEDFMKDNSVRAMCVQCNKPMPDAVRCEKCHENVSRCPICWEVNSPYDTHGPSRLLTFCLLCGHSGHSACLEAWFGSCGGDGCPTEGCLCDCVGGGFRDEKAAKAEKEAKATSSNRVKSDDWKVQQSSAVEAVRTLV